MMTLLSSHSVSNINQCAPLHQGAANAFDFSLPIPEFVAIGGGGGGAAVCKLDPGA